MPSVKSRAGKTTIQVYDAEITAMKKTVEVLGFVESMPGSELAAEAKAVNALLKPLIDKLPRPPKKGKAE